MAFQPRGYSSAPQAGSDSQPQAKDLNSLVDQIAEAVRQKLISQGVPLSGSQGSSAPTDGSGHHLQTLLQHGADRIGHVSASPFQPHMIAGDQTLAGKIDHTLLKPDATKEEITRVCEEARKNHFATVCVNSTWVGLAAQLLKGCSTKAIAVVGFPLGAAATATKAFEAREAVKVGAEEIDMVLNIGALKSRDLSFVLEDIRKVVEASAPHAVKVILETSNLTDDEKIIGCALSKAAGAAFVKTSTGFGSGGATAEDIALMRRVVGPEMGVKASGGIRTYEDAAKMIAAGATRIGASASVAICAAAAQGGTKSSAKTKTEKAADAAKDADKKPFKNSLY